MSNTTLMERGLHRTRISVLNGGAGRGARLLQDAIASYNQRSAAFELAPVYVDPLPGRARALAARGQDLGIPAEWVEGRIEQVAPVYHGGDGVAINLNLDRPLAVAQALRAAALTSRSVLGYILIRMPRGDLYGVRLAVQPHESDMKRDAARFFEALAAVTMRNGADRVVGAQGKPEHLAGEPLYRQWFSSHMLASLEKLTAGLEPESYPIEVTPDGRSTHAMFLHDSGQDWTDPQDLASQVVSNPPLPVLQGHDLAIGESGPDGIRIHLARKRVTDGRVALRSTVVADKATLAAAEAAERDRLLREAELAVRHAQRAAVTRTRPAFTTD